MDTIPFHWDTPDAPDGLLGQVRRPGECHENWVCAEYSFVAYSFAESCFATYANQQYGFVICYLYLLILGQLFHTFPFKVNEGTAAEINQEATEKGPHNLRI